MHRRIALAGALLLVTPGAGRTAEIRYDLVGCLGGRGTHPTYRVSDSAGLPVIGRSTGPAWIEWAGFWFPRSSSTSGAPDLPPDVIAPSETPLLPKVTRLVGVFPNPIGLEAEIRFDIAPAAQATTTPGGAPPVRIELFDVNGRLAARLFDGTLPPGVHHVPWRPGHGSTGTVSNGVYFFRFICGDHEETRRVTLLR